MRNWILGLCCFSSFAAFAQSPLELRTQQVRPGVYAVIGDLGQQSYENDGLNSNLGFIVTSTGVIAINSGPSVRVAEALQRAIAKITKQPVTHVVNVNAQNHYWFGNSYFKAKGATIIAHREAARLMREQGAAQLQSVTGLLKERAQGTALVFPGRIVESKDILKLGAQEIAILHFGPAHTPGDLVVWLPQQRVLFAGDIVFTERMLALLPIGSSAGWIKAFDDAMALQPVVIVPGHGKPTDRKRATRDTREYLVALRKAVKTVFDAGGSLQDAVEKANQSRFKQLKNFALLARRNAAQAYIEIEQEGF